MKVTCLALMLTLYRFNMCCYDTVELACYVASGEFFLFIYFSEMSYPFRGSRGGRWSRSQLHMHEGWVDSSSQSRMGAFQGLVPCWRVPRCCSEGSLAPPHGTRTPPTSCPHQGLIPSISQPSPLISDTANGEETRDKGVLIKNLHPVSWHVLD